MSSRVTRSNRAPSLRHTRKRTHNQVGGAPFYKPKSDYFHNNSFVDISGMWVTKLGEAGVPAVSVTKILELFTYNATADLSGAWLDANKYRNPIMKVGLEIIMNELGITKMTEEEILTKIKDFQTTGTDKFVNNLKELFTDLEKILTLGHTLIDFEKDRTSDQDSKLEMMFKKSDIITQELFLLLLYPMRIQNLLIQSVADIILMLQDKGEMEKIKTNVTDNILKTILVNKWANYSTELCMSQTNDNIRDNFAEGVKPTTIEGVKDFWESFVDQLNKEPIQFTEVINKDLGILACEYAKHLKDPSGNDFFASKKLTVLKEYTLEDSHKDELPDIYDNIPLSKQLLPASILFLKQLECAVELSTP